MVHVHTNAELEADSDGEPEEGGKVYEMVVLAEVPQDKYLCWPNGHLPTYLNETEQKVRQIPEEGRKETVRESQSVEDRGRTPREESGRTASTPWCTSTSCIRRGNRGAAPDLQQTHVGRNAVSLRSVDAHGRFAPPEIGIEVFNVYDDGGSGGPANDEEDVESVDHPQGDGDTDYSQSSLPLYIPEVEATPWECSCCFGKCWLNAPELYETLLSTRTGEPEIPVSPMTNGELQGMLEARIARLADPGEIRSYGKMWGRPEAAKKRRRLILHPAELNDEIKRRRLPVSVRFPDRNEIMEFARVAAECGGWVDGDLKCCYFQSELARDVQKFFGCRIRTETEEVDVAFTRLPMGFSPSAKVASARSEGLRDGLPCSLLQIDNIYGTGDDLERLKAIMEQNGRNCNLAWKQVAIKSEGDVLGFHIDVSDGTAMINLPAVLARKNKILRMAARRSVRLVTAMRVIGIALRVLFVKGLPLSRFFFLVAAASDIGRVGFASMKNEQRWRDHAFTFKDSTKRQLSEVAKIMERNEKVPIGPSQTRPPTTFILAADATPTQWGGAWWRVGSGRPTFVGGKFEDIGTKETIIAEREAEAMRLTLAAAGVGESVRGEEVTALTDNATLHLAFMRGHSKNFEINYTITTLKKLDVRLIWIPSEVNPADKPSRQQY